MIKKRLILGAALFAIISADLGLGSPEDRIPADGKRRNRVVSAR
jgi:hypothetical protein